MSEQDLTPTEIDSTAPPVDFINVVGDEADVTLAADQSPELDTQGA